MLGSPDRYGTPYRKMWTSNSGIDQTISPGELCPVPGQPRYSRPILPLASRLLRVTRRNSSGVPETHFQCYLDAIGNSGSCPGEHARQDGYIMSGVTGIRRGPGMTPEMQRKIFEPLSTKRRAREPDWALGSLGIIGKMGTSHSE